MRCFFHLTNGEEELLDQEGIEVRSVDDARTEALRAIDELRRETHYLQEDWNGWTLRIVDEGGMVHSTIPLNTITFPVAGQHPVSRAGEHDPASSRSDPE